MSSFPIGTFTFPGYEGEFRSAINIAELRRIYSSSLEHGQNCVTDGGIVLGDGLGDTYVFDANSLLADNNLSVIRPDDFGPTQPGRWRAVSVDTVAPAPAPVASNTVYVHDHRLDGATSDAAAFKAATAYAEAQNKPFVRFARGKGSRSDGHYVLGTFGQNANPADRGNLRSNQTIDAEPGVVIYHSASAPYCFFTNPVGTGTPQAPNTKDWTASDALSNVTFRNLVIVGAVVAAGFSEQEAIFHLNGVSNITIENCQLSGWRGDAIYIGAGDIGGGSQNRHNRLVRIRDNLLDGINQNNRNPVSLQDCDGFWMERNYVKNACKRGGGVSKPTLDVMDPNSGFQMPSSLIDLEPNIFILDPVVRNVWITDNVCVDGGGDGVNIFLRYNSSIPRPECNITIARNTFINLRSGWSTFFEPNGPHGYHLRISQNTVQRCTRAFLYLRGDDIDTDNNSFEDCAEFGEIGYEFGGGYIDPVSNFRLRGNRFKRCGINGVGAFVIGAIQKGEISNNTFHDNSGYGFTFRKAGVTNYLVVRDNIFEAATATYANGATPSKIQTGAIGVLAFSGTPLIDFATCAERGNQYNGLPNFAWAAAGSGVTSAPTTGRWKQGQSLVGIAPPRGEPSTYYCIRSAVGAGDGTPGNARAQWATVAAPGGIPDAADYTTGIATSTGITQDGKGRLTGTAQGQWAKGSYSGAGGTQQTFRFQAPSRGSEAVFVGFTDSAAAASSLTLTDLKFGFWFQQSVARPMVRGVVQPAVTPINSGDPSGALRDCYINRHFIVRYLNGGATGTLAYIDPDTGADVSLGNYNTGAGSTNSVYPIVGLDTNDTMRFVSVAAS